MAKRKLMTELFRRMLSGPERKTATIFTTLLAGALLLGGCSQDDDLGRDSDRTAVAFSAGIEATGATAYSAAPGTRTTTGGDAWLTTDKVGIFMLTTGGSLTTPANLLADNAEYNVTDAGTGALSPASGTPIYYPQSGNVDFVAYYPYTGTTGTNPGEITAGYLYNITVAGQTSEAEQNAKDVLYAKTTNIAKTKTAVNLTFGHVLSKVTLNVTLGDGLTSFSGSDITATAFSDMPQTAILTLQDGTLTAGANADFTALKAGTTTVDATFTALLVPQPTGGTSRTVVFTVDGTDYTWTIPDGETFVTGNHYTYPVTVKLNGVEVGTPTITKWDTNDNGTGDMEEIGKGIEKVRIPAGTFLMGSPEDEPNSLARERPQHSVSICEFWMSKYPITNAQYAAFLNDAGIDNLAQAEIEGTNRTLVSTHSWGIKWDTDKWVVSTTDYDNYPIINVTWYGATVFAEWAGGRLPTEAEWEYACRAGTTTPFGIGDGSKLYADMANFDGRYPYELPGGHISNYDGLGGHPNTCLIKTTEVGFYPYANAWDLYDMHGNVFEWTSSYWTGSYSERDMANPNTSYRVLRGGFWNDHAQYCRSAYRYGNFPDYAGRSVGFRVAFVP